MIINHIPNCRYGINKTKEIKNENKSHFTKPFDGASVLQL